MPMKSLLIVTSFILLSTPVITSSQCGSGSDRERMLLDARPQENVESAALQDEAAKEPSYRALLVSPEKYTTGGAAYHRKYERCLLAIGFVLAGKKKLSVAEQSIGIYHDRRDVRKERYFLGLDVNAPRGSFDSGDPFEKNAPRVLESQLGDIVSVAYTCSALFAEEHVTGMVIGFRWAGPGGAESLGIWIDKRDLKKYEQRELLLKELIGRSEITNAKGKLVRLIP
jgi:hypothetical protein